MGKGKKSASAKRRPGDGRIQEKENKPTAGEGQLTIQSCLNLSKPLRNKHTEENAAARRSPEDTSEPSPICGASEQTTAVPHKGAGTSTQRINGEKSTDRKLKEKQSETNRKVTDYFPVRRSCRKSKAELKVGKPFQNTLYTFPPLYSYHNTEEVHAAVKSIEGKGRGVFADRAFQKDQFVVEYHGDLLEIADAKAREAQYAQDPATGCYMYYFRHHDKTYCVDATKESDRLGRLINHSKNGNLRTKLHEIGGTPHLIFLASRDVRADEELLYDYGDRSKEAVAAHPWLKH
ncbi:hypothetical protein cypCar_00012343 [Cyprinus carpio]|nr:hypothetical protein cypCar_00012343 [Cyprinus carpio]